MASENGTAELFLGGFLDAVVGLSMLARYASIASIDAVAIGVLAYQSWSWDAFTAAHRHHGLRPAACVAGHTQLGCPHPDVEAEALSRIPLPHGYAQT